MTDIIPLVKANKPTAKKAPASKPRNTGSHVYMPAPGGMGKNVKPGDLAEFHHPKHGRKHRGRVTAVGQDGYRARIADGSAVDVPHTHHLATLPTGDFGTEQGLSPQDAKEAFLGPTREGGLPATDMQVAILDVMAQHGFPIDEESITKINYDDAQKIISKFVMDDMSGERTRGPQASDMQPGGSEAKDGTDMAPGAPGGPTEGAEGPTGDPKNAAEAQGQQEAEQMGPEDLEPPDEEGQEDNTPGNDTSPKPGIGQPPQDEPQDGTDSGQDLRGPAGGAGDLEDQQVEPEVLAAIKKLIEALDISGESAGSKKNAKIAGKKAKV